MPAHSTQMALEGFEPPALTDRLLLLLYLQPTAAHSLAKWARAFQARHRLNGTLIEEDLLHITLISFGDHPGLPADLVERIKSRLSNFTAPAFEVELNRAISFRRRQGRKNSFVAGGEHGIESVRALRRHLLSTLSGHDVKSRENFLPHVTMMYDWEELGEYEMEPVRWNVGEFLLVNSRLGKTIHEPLARWPLYPSLRGPSMLSRRIYR